MTNLTSQIWLIMFLNKINTLLKPVFLSPIDVIRRLVPPNFKPSMQRTETGTDFVPICADEIRSHKIMDLSPRARESDDFRRFGPSEKGW